MPSFLPQTFPGGRPGLILAALARSGAVFCDIDGADCFAVQDEMHAEKWTHDVGGVVNSRKSFPTALIESFTFRPVRSRNVGVHWSGSAMRWAAPNTSSRPYIQPGRCVVPSPISTKRATASAISSGVFPGTDPRCR